MTDIGAVIGWKHNHQAGMCTADGVITEFPGGIPSQSDQDTWTTEYEAHLAATAYVANRQAAYKSLEEQADMKYWDSVNGTTTWVEHIASVKAAHPKP
jgi:hypothetical protein|tara:strand:- start:1462 stop:1755 length:294 start_codon:yes stop_codon:yes gene_type:complete